MVQRESCSHTWRTQDGGVHRHRASGAELENAPGVQKHQILFGSSYPFRAMKQSVSDYRKLGFKDSVIDDVMFLNARRVLKLGA